LFERQVEIRERLGDKKNLAIGLGNLAIQQVMIGVLRIAEANFRQSIEICREIDNAFWEAVAHEELGRLLGMRGRWEEAEAELAAALAGFEEEGHLQHQGVTWAYRALLHLLRLRTGGALEPATDREKALASEHRALELADEVARTRYPHERDYVRAHWLLGVAWRESGDLEQAERELTEALERCRRINSVDAEADILIDLGRLRRAQGDAAEARRLGEEAVTIAERCGYVLQGADAHLLLAGLDREEGKTASAREHALEARRLATCDGDDYTYKVAYDEAGAMLEGL
jgi:tetratricopeptide (TPR) repeat protein